MIPIACLIAYHYLCFKNPFKTAYTYHYVYDWARSLGGLFSGNFQEGFLGILFSQMRNGLFYTSPFLVFGIWGFIFLFKRFRSEAFLFSLLVLLPICVIAKEKEWHGGFDPRYVLPTVSFLVIPVSLWLREFLQKQKSEETKIIFSVIFATISLYSIAFQVREQSLFIERTGSFLPPFFLQRLFPNFSRLPYFLIFFGIVYLLFLTLKLLLTINKKPSFLKNFKKMVFLVPFLLMVLLLAKVSSQNDYFLLKDDFHLFDGYESDETKEWILGFEQLSKINGCVFPARANEIGSIVYRFEFDKPVCFFVVQPRAIVMYQNSFLKILASSDGKNFIQLDQFWGNPSEKTLKPVINLTNFVQNKKVFVAFQLHVDQRYAVTLADARLNSISFGAVYCE